MMVNVPGVPVIPRPANVAVPPEAFIDNEEFDVPTTVPDDNVAVT